jgi:uncharacterized protein (TIGR02599 family)
MRRRSGERMSRISREIERLRRVSPAAGFTILELLVASAVLAIIAVLMLGMTDSVRKIYTQTIPRVQAYRDARRAMEVLAASISQATLNTYLDYVNSAGDYRFSPSGNSSTFVPARYVRTSELRFLSGNGTAGTAAGSPSRPTHSVFFQAPLGVVSSGATNYVGLENLLNSVGFFIEFRDDSGSRPDFFTNLPNPPPLSHRFRLIQAIQPSDRLTVYKYTAANPGLKSSDANGTAWMTDMLASTSRVVADNIIALVILPRLGAADQAAGGYQGDALAPDYRYDSTGSNTDPALNPNSQLPPLVDLTLVAVDERAFARFQGNSSTPKDLGLGTLFQTVGDLTNSANPGYAKDLKTLEATLTQNMIDYRVFSVGVPIKAARWSKSQKN